MSKILDLYQSLDKESQQYTDFIQNLLSISSDLPFNTDEVNTLQNSIISIINSKLNQSLTRCEGLRILLDILPRCSKELLQKYAILWLAKATQVLANSQSELKDIDLASKVIAHLTISCKEIPDLQKQVSMQSVKQLITLVSNLEEEKRTGGTFYIIATLLSYYPEPCERFQATIQKMIIPLIDSKQQHLVRAGANCFTLLANATERSFKAPANFSDYTCAVYNQGLICNNLHFIIDDLFSGLIEFESADIWGKLELSDISEDNIIQYYCDVERRFQNLCTFLSTMLSGCAGEKFVCPDSIIKLVCRGLAVTPDILRRNDSFKSQMLYLILPKLQMNLLKVLDAFINGFRQELVPFAWTILQLYRQTLKWTDKIDQTNNTTMSGSKPFRNMRIAVYKSLTVWLSCLGTLSGIDMIAEDIVPHIIKDITPEKDQVHLSVQKAQNLSRKAMKKFKESQYENSKVLGAADKNEKNSLANTELCNEALVALQNIFYNTGILLEPILYRTLHTLVVPLLLDIYLRKDDQSLYSKSPECRLNLLKSLRAIQMNPHPLQSPPTQYSIQIFRMASTDNNEKILNESKIALAELEKISHPSAAPLHYPPPIFEDVHNPESISANNANDKDSTERIKGIVKEINHLRTESTSKRRENGKEVENVVQAEKIEVVIRRGEKKNQNQCKDIEVINNVDEPPQKRQKKIKIIDEIVIPACTDNIDRPSKAPSIEEIPQDKSPSQISSNSNHDSMNSDQPIEIIKEISTDNDVTILENEPKSSSNDNESDEEAMLRSFCDKIEEN